MNVIKLLDRPIAFHRCLVDATGSVNAALLISQAVYWQNRPTRESSDGWWYKTYEGWKEETGLSRRDFEKARKACIRLLVLEYKVKGVPPMAHYRVDCEHLQIILDTVYKSNLYTEYKLNCPPQADLFVQGVQIISTETNTETKAETNVRTRKDRGSLEEIKEYCKECLLPESDAVWFFNKCEGNGWNNGGKPIKNWRATINSWQAAGYMASQNGSTLNRTVKADGKTRTVYELTKIMEAKQKLNNELAGRFSHESATGRQWSNNEARLEYMVHAREIREIYSKIAAMQL